MTSEFRIPLSVVVASRNPWPAIEPCLNVLVPQVSAVGGEIVVADGGDALPADLPSKYSGVVRLIERGAGSFRLRQLAVAQARGGIIAITEDHCVPRAGWCDAILRSHAEHPSAAAIGGAVENGATQHLVDWAGFFIANGPFMLPIVNGESPRISLQANITYKRRALDAFVSNTGLMEMLWNQELRKRSETLVADDRLVVDHVQCLDLATFCTLHFHNGRSIAGFRLERISGFERLVRLGGCAILPLYMLVRTLQTLAGKGRLFGRALLTVPLMCILLICHAAGEFLGYLAGPGHSPSYQHIG